MKQALDMQTRMQIDKTIGKLDKIFAGYTLKENFL